MKATRRLTVSGEVLKTTDVTTLTVTKSTEQTKAAIKDFLYIMGATESAATGVVIRSAGLPPGEKRRESANRTAVILSVIFALVTRLGR